MRYQSETVKLTEQLRNLGIESKNFHRCVKLNRTHVYVIDMSKVNKILEIQKLYK